MRLILLTTVLGLLLSGCAGGYTEAGLKKAAFAYAGESLPVEEEPVIEIDSESGNLEVFSWDRQEIKFEISKRVKGAVSREELEKSLENFAISALKEQGKIRFTSRYQGAKKRGVEGCVDVRLFLPRKVKEILLKLENGNVQFYDDLNCSFHALLRKADLKINSIRGAVSVEAEEGNLQIGSGRLKSGSSMMTGVGNIKVAAELESEGIYRFETGYGNIELKIPAPLDISVESEGFLKTNEFPDFNGATKIKAISRVGRIEVLKAGA